MRTDPPPELAPGEPAPTREQHGERGPVMSPGVAGAVPPPRPIVAHGPAMETPLVPVPEGAPIPEGTPVREPDGRVEITGPSFARALWRVASADVSSGNRAILLRDGPATFDCMAALIDQACESVDLEGYIWRCDEVGDRFCEALVRAAARGVRTRLLVDWIGRMGAPTSYFKRELADKGVEVRIFNPPGFRAWLGLLPRDHRKVLVVDRRRVVTGGIGIGTEWLGGVAEKRRQRWRDTAVLLEGDAAVDVQQAFDRMWARMTPGARPPRRLWRWRQLRRRGGGTHLDPRKDPPALVGIIEGEPLRLRVERALQMQCMAAQRTVWIATAYFAPSLYTIEALIGAARDGVDVRILVPSRYDHPWVGWLARRYYKRLLRHGVRIWEWRGEMMHAKTSVIDGRWVRVGSTDFNPLGIAINYELDAVIEDPELGRAAEEMFLADLERSQEIVMAGAAGTPEGEQMAR